jgi:DNA-directed RNA polymerase specialized sigma24 family protein
MDEKQAIQRLKQGDIHGLEFLVDQFQVKSVRVAYLITRDFGLAEEIVQESFVKVYRSMRTFDENSPFEPWFLRSVVNASVKMMQRSARQVEMGRMRMNPCLQNLFPKEKSFRSARKKHSG